MVEHGAVTDALLAIIGIRPGVTVGIKMHQGDWPVFFSVGLEQWVGDEMISAQGQHGVTRVEDALGMGLNGGRGLLWLTVVEVTVTVIDHGQMVEGVEHPGIVALPGALH